uniref:Uncharacterized protein n=1 Tax=Globodera rostochiensis TaxID=31243 RepID=A0A914H4P7_GLORO
MGYLRYDIHLDQFQKPGPEFEQISKKSFGERCYLERDDDWQGKRRPKKSSVCLSQKMASPGDQSLKESLECPVCKDLFSEPKQGVDVAAPSSSAPAVPPRPISKTKERNLRKRKTIERRMAEERATFYAPVRGIFMGGTGEEMPPPEQLQRHHQQQQQQQPPSSSALATTGPHISALNDVDDGTDENGAGDVKKAREELKKKSHIY